MLGKRYRPTRNNPGVEARSGRRRIARGSAAAAVGALGLGMMVAIVTPAGAASATTCGELCVLNPSGTSLGVSGNGVVTVLAGGANIDSGSPAAVTVAGNGGIVATPYIDITGGAARSGNGSIAPTPATGVAAAPDPLSGSLSSLPLPTAPVYASGYSVSGNNSKSIGPGVYASISATGNSTLTLQPGYYVVEAGGFTVSGNAMVEGSGVTIYLTCSSYPTNQCNGKAGGSLSVSGNGILSFTAPSGSGAGGIAIALDPTSTGTIAFSGNANDQSVNGQQPSIGGILYAAEGALTVSGNAKPGFGAADLASVAVSGNGSLRISGSSSYPSGNVAVTTGPVATMVDPNTGVAALTSVFTGTTACSTTTTPFCGALQVTETNSGGSPGSAPVTASIVSAPPGATLAGTLTETPVSGVATFGNLTVTTPGPYELQFAASGFAPADASFNAYPSYGITSCDAGATECDAEASDSTGSVDVNTGGLTNNSGETLYIAASVSPDPDISCSGDNIVGGVDGVSDVDSAEVFDGSGNPYPAQEINISAIIDAAYANQSLPSGTLPCYAQPESFTTNSGPETTGVFQGVTLNQATLGMCTLAEIAPCTEIAPYLNSDIGGPGDHPVWYEILAPGDPSNRDG